jgi:UDP-N-acetylmuramyl pentapeptide phosphotransferase/UDP-N-acetylglucosamine-1-phosphate transferase
MNALSLTLLTVTAFLASAVGTGVLRRLLTARRILDYPGTRSSHEAPTPRGGGLAIYVVLMAAWGGIALTVPSRPSELGWIMACSLGLAIVSWIDDLVGLPKLPRLLCQIVIAGAGTYLLDSPLPVFQGLVSPALDTLGTVFLWVGFINLFNFTDGIDGNAGTKATVLGIGVFLFSLSGVIPVSLGYLGVAVAAVAAGFLIWNWHPARIFMGDVGSVTLGFVLAWLLLRTAGEGEWAPAVILPLIYVSDTGLTYLLKILRGERFWNSHRDHYYQRAVRARGVTHAHVVKIVLFGDAILVLMAMLATQGVIWPSLLGAGGTAVAVLAYLALGLGGGTAP